MAGWTWRQVVASLLVVLALGTLSAQAATVSVPATAEAIQDAINNATENSGTIIQIAGGIVTAGGGPDMGTKFIRVNKHGVSLHGSTDPANPTIFQTNLTTANPGALGVNSCLDAGAGLALLQVCRRTTAVPPTQPITIKNIIFKSTYTDSSLTEAPFGGAEKGIFIEESGISTANPNIVQNCQFLNMWKAPGATGIGIEFSTTGQGNRFWLLDSNTFDSTRQGMFINANSYITITRNTLTRFWTGVRQSSTDISTNIAITDNSFVGWTTDVPLDGVQAIAFSAASSSLGSNKNWQIRGNLISGVNTAFEIRGASLTSWSMTGMDIQENSINATYRCSASFPCWNINNVSPASPVPVANNWWGSNPPNAAAFYPSVAAVTLEPFITDFTDPPPGTCVGFCPTDVVNSNTVTPVIVSVTPDPSTVSAGQLFSVNVTLQAPITGSVVFTSDPRGILCQDRELTNDKSVSSICSTPQTTAAMAAVVASEAQRGAVAVASTTQAQPAQQVVSSTTEYSLTATVTADEVATASTTVRVCQNAPWPFRAETTGCRQCGYNCATGVFSCTGCSCFCRKARPLYREPETPYGPHKAYSDREDDDSRENKEDASYREQAPEAGDDERPYGASSTPHQEAEALEPDHRSYTEYSLSGEHSSSRHYADSEAPGAPSDEKRYEVQGEKKVYRDAPDTTADESPEGDTEAPYHTWHLVREEEEDTPQADSPKGYTDGDAAAGKHQGDKEAAYEGSPPAAKTVEPPFEYTYKTDAGEFEDSTHYSRRPEPSQDREYAAGSKGTAEEDVPYSPSHSSHADRTSVDTDEEAVTEQAPAEQGALQDALQDASTDASADAEPTPADADSTRADDESAPADAEATPESRLDPVGQDDSAGQEVVLEETNGDRFVRWLAKGAEDDSRDAPYQQRVQEQGSRAGGAVAQIAAVWHPLVSSSQKDVGDIARVKDTDEQVAAVPAATTALWHPMLPAYRESDQAQPRYGRSAYEGVMEADCSSETSKECVCGPAPLTVAAGCDSVVYNPCTNTLSCSSGGGYY